MASLSFGRTKRRLLSTFILALGLVVQPFSMVMANTAYAASDYSTTSFSDWVSTGGTITGATAPALEGDAQYANVNGSVFTRWGGYESIFPTDGYTTSLDVYLDMAVADGSSSNHFEFSSAINNVSGNHLRDFIFHVGVDASQPGKWFVSANNNANSAVSSHLVSDSAEVTQTGWYSMVSEFANDGSGVLAVTMKLVDRDTDDVVGSWLLSTPADTIPGVVGGHRYGWFVSQPFANLPVDNATLTTNGPRLITNTTTNETFNTIQSAIDDADTVAGNVIQLGAGMYTENLSVTKAVTIVGPNVGINPVTDVRNNEAVLTGQISVYASNVIIDGLTVTNPSYSGPTIRGVHVYGSGAGIANVTVSNNIFTDIDNAFTKGSYGIMVQGAVSGVEVTNNLMTGITSAGWAHAIEVTPAGGVVTTPTDVTVTGNSISGVANAAATDQYDFSVDSSGSVFANASEITFSGNRLTGMVRNLDTNNTLDASGNWWGQTTGAEASQYSGNITVTPWCTWDDCSTQETDEPLELPAVAGVAQVAVDTILDNSSSMSNVRAVLPGGTTVTSDPAWNGTINAPTVTSYTVPGAASTGLAITAGSNDYTLSFDHAVQLYFPGQAGKSVGFKAPGGNFTEITTTCVANDPSVDTQLVAPLNDCKMTYGNDLIVWTKHFTIFATFTPQTVSQGGNTSGTSTTRSGNVFSPTVYDDTWMEGANTKEGETFGEVKSNNVGVSGTATVSDDLQELPTNGISWYWWLLGGVLAAGAWSLVSLIRSGRFNR